MDWAGAAAAPEKPAAKNGATWWQSTVAWFDRNILYFIGATAIFRRTIRSGFAGVRKANGEINTALSETISGSREIHLFQVKTEARNRFEQCNRGYLSAYLQVVRAYAFYFPVLELVSNGGMVVMLLYAHYAMGIELEPGIVFAFFAYLNMFFFPLRQMAEKFNLFQSAMAAAERARGSRMAVSSGRWRRRRDRIS